MDVTSFIQYGALGVLVLWSIGAYKLAVGYLGRLTSTLDAMSDKLAVVDERSRTTANGVSKILRKTERLEVALDVEPTGVRDVG